jgi:hypothetical protein
MIWRIRDGVQVNIWQDPWFPSGLTRQSSTLKGICPLETVAELINLDTLSWKREVIDQYFLPADIPIILSIPLRHRTEDFVGWHFDQKGVFLVKSAYKVHAEKLKREAVKQVGQGSNAMPIYNEVFKKLWKTPCPPRVHHFFWRLAHNSHPLYMNIARRGVELDTRCAVCHNFFEDGGHLFLKCKDAK